MNILSWVIFGLAVGIIIHLLDPRPEQGGAIGAMVLGLLGAMLGGLLGNVVLGIGFGGFSFTSFSIALLGSLLLLFMQRAFRGSTNDRL